MIKKVIKYYSQHLVILLPLALLPTIVLIIENIISDVSIRGNEKYAKIMVISAILPQLTYLFFIIITCVYIFKKLKGNIFKKVFFIFYFLFFIFYFLFFIFYDPKTIGEHYFSFMLLPRLLYPILAIILGFFLIVDFKKITRYKILIIAIIFNIYAWYHKSDLLYCIVFFLIIIQLLIEVNYFYQKEKQKWLRYERMQKYKQSKNL